ncbi:FAD binding domain-containing protein [Colletotrichum navitas]|uniref:FAD binding domain-containing protein n=1 Tax=Colletotrichum navitas TaxID=681940 RepID=A0AAD8QAB7_9PEZI|nr:FAD binding domain-containing protein [Colletotrichum navitas]KAK1598966.1 FAD binding domain-containing protein [Colletotrichum navitas]
MGPRNFLRHLVVASLLCLTSAHVPAQANSTAFELQKCLTTAGVRNVISADATWAKDTAGFQKRIKVIPAAISFPESNDQIALSLDCARNPSTSASVLGAAHSFQAYGFGNPGSLVISMAAFNSVIGGGGGFGSTSRHLGTPMDNLESVEYMLYNGTIVNAVKGSDLFWAAQGAGASFGVLLSVTTNTYKPLFDIAVNFTINAGDLTSTKAAKSLVAIQRYSLSEDCPDELALRWSLSGPPYIAKGFFYGDPAGFDTVIAPLLKSLNDITGCVTVQKTELPFWDMEVAVAGPGMNQLNGGALSERSFYTQSLTITTDHPLTVEQAKVLYESTDFSFNRTDMRKSGFIDLWGGVSRDISDTDTSFGHGKNLWLIRWESSSVDITSYPADGPAYMKSLFKPFEEALVASGAPLRGFVNYADTELSQAEWSSRLYGANFDRLKQLKAVYDPEGLFVNHKQAIPMP